MALARGAKRTPFGTFGGLLKNHSANTLQELSAKAALTAANVNPEAVDSVIFGNVIQSSSDAAYLARHVALRCGIPVHTPAVTVNRLCGSGFQSIVQAAQEIQLRESDVVLCGGSENMTQAPFAIRNARFGVKLGSDMEVEDTLWTGLTDQHINTAMGQTAENLADKYKLSRDDADNMALYSQTKWKEAHTSGRFAAEIEPIVMPGKGKGGVDVVMNRDEHPRDTTSESLAKLPPVFKKWGTVTAGNASGVGDGAASLIVCSEEAVKKYQLTPLVQLVGYHVCGCDPHIMGIGPVPAIRSLLDKTGQKLDNMDMIEINEAFASQCLSVMKELGLQVDRCNVSGGAIALAHPLGASGARISTHIAHQLPHVGKYAIGSACIGGGQGIALMFKHCSSS